MIAISEDALKRVSEILSAVPNGASEAYRKALNAGIRTARTKAGQAIRKTYAIDSAGLRTNTTITLKYASGYNSEASIRYSGNKIPLYRFNVSPKMAPSKGVVSAGVLRSSGRTPFHDAFIQRMKSGHVGMLERDTDKRLPISELMAVSVAQMAERAEVLEATEQAAQEKVNTTLEQEISRILNKY